MQKKKLVDLKTSIETVQNKIRKKKLNKNEQCINELLESPQSGGKEGHKKYLKKQGPKFSKFDGNYKGTEFQQQNKLQ